MGWLWAPRGAKDVPSVYEITTRKESPEQGHGAAHTWQGLVPSWLVDMFPLLRINCPSYGSRIFVLRSDALPLITTTTATFYMSRKKSEQSLGI